MSTCPPFPPICPVTDVHVGQAIKASRGSSPCTDKVFTTDYANCLSCAGPDNYDIWQYYGDSVTKAADTCDLDATPAGGNATTATGTTTTGATATGASATSSGVSSYSKIGLESGKLIL